MVEALGGVDVASSDAMHVLLAAFMKTLDHIEYTLRKGMSDQTLRMAEQMSCIDVRLSHLELRNETWTERALSVKARRANAPDLPKGNGFDFAALEHEEAVQEEASLRLASLKLPDGDIQRRIQELETRLARMNDDHVGIHLSRGTVETEHAEPHSVVIGKPPGLRLPAHG